jgi:hypothetical protein
VYVHSNLLSEQLKNAMELKRNEMIELRGDDAFYLPAVRKVKQDVPTRWNFTYSMIKSGFDCIKTIINNNSEAKRKYSDSLSTYFEISLIDKLIELFFTVFRINCFNERHKIHNVIHDTT